MPKISVLVPAYNTGAYIGECLESILKQTYTDMEIIIVNDGSEDDTLAVATGYAKLDNRIKIISTDHRGVAESRNECLRNATGEYVLFVDSDDWIASALCENLHREAIRTSADIVFAPMVMVSTDGTESIFGDRSIVFNDNEVLTGPLCFVRMVEAGCAYPMVAGNLYSSELFADNQINFKGEYHEDEYSFPLLLKSAARVCNIVDLQYYYRQRPKSIMNNNSNFKERSVALGKIANEFESELLTCETYSDHSGFIEAVSRHIAAIKEKAHSLYDIYFTSSKRPLVLVLTEKSISSNYGIGTYIRHIADSSSDLPWDFLQIELNAYDKIRPEFSIEHGMPCYSFPSRNGAYLSEKEDCVKKYQYSVFYYLASRIEKERHIMCHINAYGFDYMSILFKEHFNAKIVFTVHYMDWSFRLNGDKDELERILADSKPGAKEASVIKSFKKEKHFLNACCDRVIAIARHSYDTLHRLYRIPKEKLTLIFHSAPFIPEIIGNKASLRNKYGFAQTDRIVIFAGRIDIGKGIFELVRAFKRVAANYPELRLIIAGDGAFSSLYRQIKPMWNNILLTGYVDKKTLYELYCLSDLGMVPSLYEEFGYVAVEMASIGLPVVVNPKGGLAEIAHKISTIKTIDYSENDNFANAISNVLATYALSAEEEVCNESGGVLGDKQELLSVYTSLIHD